MKNARVSPLIVAFLLFALPVRADPMPHQIYSIPGVIAFGSSNDAVLVHVDCTQPYPLPGTGL